MSTTDNAYLIRCPACGTANRVPAEKEGKTGSCGACHSHLPPLFTKPVPLSDQSFDPFLSSCPGLLLAEFWAPW